MLSWRPLVFLFCIGQFFKRIATPCNQIRLPVDQGSYFEQCLNQLQLYFRSNIQILFIKTFSRVIFDGKKENLDLCDLFWLISDLFMYM